MMLSGSLCLNDGEYMEHLDTELLIREWQEIVDLLADIIDVPAGLIMKLDQGKLEVLVSSKTPDNPYKVGENEVMEGSGLYCETVIKSNKKLKVTNALTDEKWKNNPDIKLNMISYLGFPILYPDKKPFGTICILDSKENHFTTKQEKIITKLRDLIERELTILDNNFQLKKLSEIDKLTQINNRYCFIEKAERDLKRSIRYKRQFSLIFFDLDFFKKVNDTYGHQAGDAVLKEFAKTVNGELRSTDIFGRYGGEEFIVALPETDLKSAKLLAERIRKKVEMKNIAYEDDNISVTVSAGVSELLEDTRLEAIINRADKALYKAKQSGRNKVC